MRYARGEVWPRQGQCALENKPVSWTQANSCFANAKMANSHALQKCPRRRQHGWAGPAGGGGGGEHKIDPRSGRGLFLVIYMAELPAWLSTQWQWDTTPKAAPAPGPTARRPFWPSRHMSGSIKCSNHQNVVFPLKGSLVAMLVLM